MSFSTFKCWALTHCSFYPLVSLQMSVAPTEAGVYEDVRVSRVSDRGPGVTAVYVTAEAGAAERHTAASADFLYTAGDKLRITLPK